MGTHRGHLTCTWEPGKKVTPLLSHRGKGEVSQLEAKGRKSEAGLERDMQGTGADREDLRWAQVCDLCIEVEVTRFRRSREGKATGSGKAHLSNDFLWCLGLPLGQKRSPWL